MSDLHSELMNLEKGIPTTERIVPTRKSLTSREITVQFSLKKLFIPALIVIAVVAIGLIIWQILPKQKAPPLAPSGKLSLAVMYFTNKTGDENLGIWRTALPELITIDLSQSKFINILSADRLFSILKKVDLLDAENVSPEDLAKVADEGGVGNILCGSYAKTGEKFRILTTLKNMKTGEARPLESVEFSGENAIFTAVDELAIEVKKNLTLSHQGLTADFDKPAGTITTTSPRAYKYYAEARKQHLELKYKESIELYDKAVSLDHGFAMAFKGLASACSSLGLREQSTEATQRALKSSDRLSERERLGIKGQYYAYDGKTYDKAIETLDKLLKIYPDDTAAINLMGGIYGGLEEYDKALAFREMEYRIHKDMTTYKNLADGYESLGRYQEAIEVYEDYITHVADNADMHRNLSSLHAAEGKFAVALAEAGKAFLTDPENENYTRIKGNIFYLQDDLVGAEKEFQKLLDAKSEFLVYGARTKLAMINLFRGEFRKAIEQRQHQLELAQRIGEKGWEAWAHWALFYLYMKKGDIKAAEAEVEALEKISHEENFVSLNMPSLRARCLLEIEKGSLSRAESAAEELKKLLNSIPFKKLGRFYFNLKGRIELRKNNQAAAIKNFMKAVNLDPKPETAKDILLLDDLGLTYFRKRDMSEARKVYGRIRSQTNSKWDGDIYVRSLYMLGLIAEIQDNKTEAAEHYRKFLDLWKDADPGIAEVEDARKRLAGLKSQ